MWGRLKLNLRNNFNIDWRSLFCRLKIFNFFFFPRITSANMDFLKFALQVAIYFPFFFFVCNYMNVKWFCWSKMQQKMVFSSRWYLCAQTKSSKVWVFYTWKATFFTPPKNVYKVVEQEGNIFHFVAKTKWVCFSLLCHPCIRNRQHKICIS